MGSGSSKSSKSTASSSTGSTKQNDNSKQHQSQQQRSSSPTLLGSSSPPTGLPTNKIINNEQNSQQNHNGTESKQHDMAAQHKETESRPMTVENGTSNGVHNGGPSTNGTVNRTRPPASARSRKGLHSRAGTRKSIVRQMERGIDDEEDVDNILGISRMKSKMLLKREQTQARLEQLEQLEEHVHKNNKFLKAAKRIQRRELQYDGPATKADELLVGNVSVQCPATSKIVRIFTSSPFTDTTNERNKLMEDAYPRVKVFCQQLGYDFQVVDMRWGVRDQATDDHMGTEICLNELKMCQKLSTGPNFVSLLSHKYGYSDFPRTVEASEFETILENVQSDSLTKLFKKWYAMDLNAVPAAYVVARISDKIPDFVSKDKEKKDIAKKQWYEESEAIQTEMERVVVNVFDEDTARKYTRSVTETETTEGILNMKGESRQSIWLKRNIENIEQQEASYLLSRYIECTFNNTEQKVAKTREMLKQLEDDKMPNKIPADKILKYNVKWNKEKGIDPISESSHRAYLEQMSEDFVKTMSAMILSAAAERKQTDDPLVEEIVQHVTFCQDKVNLFHGRTGVLEKIKQYVLGMSNEPLVLHGTSGSGKTSIMAMATKEAWRWLKGKATIVLRFIGTTPNSSSLQGLLSNVTSNIRKAYGMSWTVSEDLTTLVDEFHLALFLATSERPLLVVFDSLDMLDPSHNARQLQWLPSKLRPNVKIIVSTLPESQYESYPALQLMVKTSSNFLEVPKLPDTDVSGIIDKYLALKQRKLTADQKKIVMSAFVKCPIPLFLKLSLDTASTWTSFTPKPTTVLESTVRASIDSLFQKLETQHGHLFVSRTLGYLTTARAGLTETELEDVLSCDDDVLNDVYMYWTPPIRRLPPLLLVRLRSDLSQYLVERGVDNVRVMYWYHRQFVEAAMARYVTKDTDRLLHTALADFFEGTWSNGKKKPYVTKNGENASADRHVASQPNKYGSAYNLRKFNNLPYHRCSAKQLDLLKNCCLCNFEFLLMKLRATSLWQVIDDFTLAIKEQPNDELLRGINDVLHLSQEGLMNNSDQLAAQVIGRLSKENPSYKEFIQQCLEYPVPSILPDKQILTQPGGQLVHMMAGHKGDILSLDLTQNSKTALTCSDDGSIRLWSIEAGKLIRAFEGLGKITRALFCFNDEYIVIEMNKKLTIRSVVTGDTVYDIKSVNDDFPVCVVGNNKSALVVFKEQVAMLYNLMDGVNQFSIEISGNFEFKFPGFAVGSKNFAAVTTSDQVYLTVLDISKKQFTKLFRGFEPFSDEELGESIQYEIDEMSITPDEKHVIFSNIYTNDIVFLDFRSQTITKTIKGNPNDYVRSLRTSLDGKYLYLVKAAFVNFYDIKKSRMTEELEHTVDVISVCSNDMKTVVTTAEDSSVRVWDRTRKVQKLSQTPGIKANKIRMMTSHLNSRYLIGFGFKTRETTSQFIFVYDVMKQCSVQERDLDSSILQFEIMNDKELLVLSDVIHKLHVVNIDTLKITRHFQGYLPEQKWKFSMIESRQEVACLSCGRQTVKLYNATTGKVVAILENNNAKLDGVIVNGSGTILVCWCEESGPILIFDIVKRHLLHTLHPMPPFIPDATNDDIALSGNGELLVFKVEDIPPKSNKGNLGDDEVYLQVWDTRKGSKVSTLVDLEYYNRYQAEKVKSGLSSAVDTFHLLDNKTIIVAHDDFVMRVFDMYTGNILHRLFGHSTSIEIINSPNNPYLLTYGSWTEENTLRMWSKQDFTCTTSYTLDKTITNLHYSNDGKFIIATTGKPAEIVSWKMNNFKEGFTVTPSDYKETISGPQLQGYLDLVPEDESIVIDPDDPDKDVMEYEADSDDDDDFI